MQQLFTGASRSVSVIVS